MIRALLVIMLVAGALVGGLLALRASGRLGMPSDEVIKRARRREQERRTSDDDESSQS